MSEVTPIRPDLQRAGEASIALEQEIIGGALYCPQVMPYLRASLSPEHFAEPMHGRLWELMCAIQDEQGAVGPILLGNRVGEAEGPGMPLRAYVARLVSDTCGTVKLNPDGIVAELLNNYARRQAESIGGQLIESARGLGDPAAAATDAISGLDRILTARQKTRRTDTDLSGALSAALLAAQDRKDGGERAEVSTGLGSLDRRLGGFWPGQLIILAGRPAMGKSNMLNALMLNTSLAGHGTVLFSKEMDTEEVGQRAAATLISSRFGSRPIAYDDLRRGRFDQDHQGAIERAIDELRDAPVRIDVAPGLSVVEIAARVRRYREEIERQGRRLAVVMVDYLQIVRPSGRYAGQRVNEIAEITSALKQLAKQNHCTVILASQLSRQVENREDKRPMMSDLRDSGAIEQDADVICFLYREAYYLSRKEDRSMEEENHLERVANVTEFLVAKQRHGSTGTERLFTDMATGVVSDLGGPY